jgi:hypothetical protein
MMGFTFASAQESPETSVSAISEFDQVYGPDYNLINGKKYIDLYASAQGHPFLDTRNFNNGWLKLKGEIYEDVPMLFNIFEQQLLLQVSTGNLGTQQLIVPNLYLESFGYQGRLFRKLRIPELGLHFWEFLTEDRYSIVFSYDKRYTVSRSAGFQGYFFSEVITRRYVYDEENNKLIRYKNNSTFRNAFPPEKKGEIKAFMKEKKIRVKKAGKTELIELMHYINENF